MKIADQKIHQLSIEVTTDQRIGGPCRLVIGQIRASVTGILENRETVTFQVELAPTEQQQIYGVLERVNQRLNQ